MELGTGADIATVWSVCLFVLLHVASRRMGLWNSYPAFTTSRMADRQRPPTSSTSSYTSHGAKEIYSQQRGFDTRTRAISPSYSYQ